MFFEKDEKRKAEWMERMQKEIVPTAMANLEAILAKNGGKHMVGNDVRFEIVNKCKVFISYGFR